MTHTEMVVHTVGCDLKDCPTEVSGIQFRFWDFMDKIKKWGWECVWTTSPHPHPPGVVAWSIIAFFCPEHRHLAGTPERWIIVGSKTGRKRDVDHVVEYVPPDAEVVG